MKELTLENLYDDEACSEGIAWITPLLESGGPTEEDWLQKPGYWEWALSQGYDVPLIPSLVAALEPPTALAYARDCLTDDEVLELARQVTPGQALQYAAKRLPDDEVLELARLDPWAGLQYAADRLPADVLTEPARRYPWAALAYAADRLPADVLAELQEAAR